MLPPVWLSLLSLPTRISTPGTYRTRDGSDVTIERVAGRKAYGSYSDGTKEWWHTSGRLLPWSESKNDIV